MGHFGFISISNKALLVLLLALCGVLGAALPAGTAGAAGDDEERLANDMPVPVDDATAIARGKDRFGERCGFCHGGGGKGGKGPCLICGHFKRGGKSSNIYVNIAAGVQGTAMGAFGTTLSQEDILGIIAFLRVSTKKHLEEVEAEEKQ